MRGWELALPPGAATICGTMPRSPYAAEPAAPPAEVAAPTRTPQGKVREKLDQSKPKSFKTYSRFGRDPEVYFWTIDHVLYGLARAAARAGVMASVS